MSFHFNHFNINVTDVERSIEFYRQALGLEPVGCIDHPDKGYKITYLSAPGENFRLEQAVGQEHPGSDGRPQRALQPWRERKPFSLCR